MRAAKTESLFDRMMQRWHIPNALPTATGKNRIGRGAGLGILLLLGYAAGVMICREQVPAAGQALAQYYMDKQNYLKFSDVCVAQFSALFLQAGIVVLCGGSMLGNIFLAVFFAGRGLVLGVCASAVFLAYQARGLVVYWLLTFLPDAAALILLLWLAQKSAELATMLLRAVLSNTAARGVFQEKIRSLLLRSLLVLIVGACCSALGAAAAGLFAQVLL